MNLSNDIVDFPIFRVMAGQMKKELGDKVSKLKEEILKAISHYCQKSVEDINNTFKFMYDKIQ
jgi:septum formation topological specificity factor MinE